MRFRTRFRANMSSAQNNRERRNAEIAYRAALEGIVLLENDGTLPIHAGKIALYGAGASLTIKGGTGSGEVADRHDISIQEGLEQAGFVVTTQAWLDGYEKCYREGEAAHTKEVSRHFFKADFINFAGGTYRYPFGGLISQLDIASSDTDTAIYVVARQAGECADRRMENGDYELSHTELQNITLCAETYSKFILVINAGCSVDMSKIQNISGINAIIFFGQQGCQGGRAFADILTGKVSPSGKLTDTWSKNYSDIPFHDQYSYLNGNLEEEFYREGIFVGYRYFDTFGIEPQYPFGYGMSYTDFKIDVLSVAVDGTCGTVDTRVTNVGSHYSGKDVVQLYISCPNGTLSKEYQTLAAFGKTNVLAPGQQQMLRLPFDLQRLSSFSEAESAFLLEKGKYIVRVGEHSRSTKIAGVLSLTETVVVSRHKHICPQNLRIQELCGPERTEEMIPTDVPICTIDPHAFQTETFTYGEPSEQYSETVNSLLTGLTDDEKVKLLIGCGRGVYTNAIGSAGYTTGELLSKGIPNVCLADGPAGLRLQRVTTLMKNGLPRPGEMDQLGMLNYLPKILRKAMVGNVKKDLTLYQFTTAFPVETSLAQSWNTALAEEVGRAVSDEMSEYGVTYWLAPALNIHRNPLCGRNYEYFSEDPFLSGMFAAAVTRGVQSTPGNYVTLKHFCCNNQEENRNHTSANVSERTLREIYLRGFEYAVKESHPGAVMSPYNKLNGVYVNNSFTILTDVLRNEWGFDGIVMTDWNATGKGVGSHVIAIQSGNDLIMPGSKEAYNEIRNAVKSGQINADDLNRSAARVLEGVVNSQIYMEFTEDKYW